MSNNKIYICKCGMFPHYKLIANKITNPRNKKSLRNYLCSWCYQNIPAYQWKFYRVTKKLDDILKRPNKKHKTIIID